MPPPAWGRDVRRIRRDRAAVTDLFARAGVTLDGDRPSDIRVHHDGFYRRVLADGSLGLGESYVDGWWDSPRVDELTARLVRAKVDRIRNPRLLLAIARARASGGAGRAAAFEVGRRHYDLGNDLFVAMLDARAIYSCAYWNGATTLDEAQENKLDLVCRKLALAPGMRVLEIGCGWGGFAKFAAERYGVSVVGLTISTEQAAFARAACAGLPIEIRLQDYRRIDERFDRVVSIGMFEHVGRRYHRTFANVVARCLCDGGTALLHTIVGELPVGKAELPWLETYIFPNGAIPSLRQVAAAVEGRLRVEAVHRFGDDYERTLARWLERFVERWPSLERSYDARFYRMWTYYLASARGLFASGRVSVMQFVLSQAVAGAEASTRDARRLAAESR